MELRDLKTFVVVADLLNFNQAGKALHAAQSTISVRIGLLEDELGLRLFDRLGRRVMLTEAGKRLQEYAKKLVDMEEEARGYVSCASGTGGALVIRIPESLAVERFPGIVGRFQARYPKVRLRLLPCAMNGLTEDLRRGVTDLAFVLAYEVLSRDMRSAFLGVEPLVVAAAASHPLAALPQVGPRDVAETPLLLTTSDCSYRRMFEAVLAEAGLQPHIGVECGSVAAVVRYVAAGLGITIVPAVAIRRELAEGSLVALPWAEGPLEAGVLMLWHKDKWLSPALTAFMDLCRADLGPDD